MGKVAFIFPGQGSQYAGMGRDLADNFHAARDVFNEADQTLGFSLSSLCFNGPEDQLQLTANTQPALLAVSIAAARVLAENRIRTDFVAGHSLGEYSALVTSDALSLIDALRLVRRRGELMQEAVPTGIGAMAAILGIDAERVIQACAAAALDGVCTPANFNTPAQIVIAGHREAVERAVEGCKTLGAKRAMMLKVSAPFHSPLMIPVQEKMGESLKATNFNNLTSPIINNVDAAIISDGKKACDGLIRQISAPVLWTESVMVMFRLGVDTFIEVGAGKVLTGLVKSIAKEAGREVRLFNVEDRASLEATLSNL
jgi:[acyl-carrier-protein] S-malonyltransferase